ncbi:unnamed protein product [Urochloa humidicola]
MSSVSSLSSPSSRKRKREWKEVVVVGGGGADRVRRRGHTVSAVFGGYGELKSVDEQLEHLEWMVMEIGNAVAAAGAAAHVPIIRSWTSLRQWLWNLQEAACEGKAVARALREEARGGGSEEAGGGNVLWEGAKLIFRSVKRALMGDEDMDNLSRALRKLERASAGTGRFLKLLEMEVPGKAESRIRSTVTMTESDLADGAESKIRCGEQGVSSADDV